jgi:purine nucleoside phosphorylase
VARLGLIAGSALHDASLPEGTWLAIRRHEVAAGYELPHRIDHVATMRALADAGCDRVLALSSVGGLRAELGPGTLLVPHDFIGLDVEPLTTLKGPEAHRVPRFDAALRGELIEALRESRIEAVEGGVYWQARGPRLETPAEVLFIAAHAEVVGMTVASECVIAGELELRYAALCVVDNLANGIGGEDLTLAEIELNRERNASTLRATLDAVLPLLA